MVLPISGIFARFVFIDVLKRFLRYQGYPVYHVMNITDVDDKTIRNSQADEPKKLREYTDRFTQAFFEDCDQLKHSASRQGGACD